MKSATSRFLYKFDHGNKSHRLWSAYLISCNHFTSTRDQFPCYWGHVVHRWVPPATLTPFLVGLSSQGRRREQQPSSPRTLNMMAGERSLLFLTQELILLLVVCRLPRMGSQRLLTELMGLVLAMWTPALWSRRRWWMG